MSELTAHWLAHLLHNCAIVEGPFTYSEARARRNLLKQYFLLDDISSVFGAKDREHAEQMGDLLIPRWPMGR